MEAQCERTTIAPGNRRSPVEVEDSRRRLQDHDATVLFGVMMTPVAWIRGPAQLHRVESEGRRVGGVRVGLHDVPREDAEYDAVAWAGTDPRQGANRAPRSSVWQRARAVVAYRA